MERWGLLPEAIEGLGERLKQFWRWYGGKTRTRTHDTREYGLAYVSGLLRMEGQRNMAQIGRETGVSEQNMQHFISNSPWSGREMIAQIQTAIARRSDWEGGMLLLDESGDEKHGSAGAGVARQYYGRHKQVERCQIGVFLAYAQGDTWSWIDGELFLPEKWFSPEYAARRAKAVVPDTLHYQKKSELGWQMIERARATGIPFVAVTFDSLYGQDSWLRDQCQREGIEYYADVKSTIQVYLRDPHEAFVPKSTGRVPQRPTILSQWAYSVADVAQQALTRWQRIELRPDARGILEADFAARQVWTIRSDGTIVEETLLLRRDGKHICYTLTNSTLPLASMARRKAQRYFVERAIQDAKSEFGWDEFQAIRYRAWHHHLALTILACWFIAETRLDWAADHPPDLTLLDDYDTDILPSLSVANVRALLRAALPLPQLSSEQAALLILHHLDNRIRSRRSKLRRRFKP
jgi:SRSO17 transposase